MKTEVLLQLILKDFQLNSLLTIFTMAGAAIALAILSIGGETPVVLGTVFFFLAIIFGACLIPMQNIVNERKKQTLPFIMSLPVSSAQYGVAKFLSSVGMFLAMWLMLLGAALYMILARHVLPGGTIPMDLILMNFPLIGFCLTTGAALVGESEGWATAALAATNSSYGLAWYMLVRHAPSLTKTWAGPIAVWSPLVFRILGVEFTIILLTLGLTMYLQSRKHSFI
ncbi:MAG TPA: ABC-2 transporter permease [Terriglobales bacterium]|nr:ABC-2 transporter permease [Terriglobales bacterium]